MNALAPVIDAVLADLRWMTAFSPKLVYPVFDGGITKESTR